MNSLSFGYAATMSTANSWDGNYCRNSKTYYLFYALSFLYMDDLHEQYVFPTRKD